MCCYNLYTLLHPLCVATISMPCYKLYALLHHLCVATISMSYHNLYVLLQSLFVHIRSPFFLRHLLSSEDFCAKKFPIIRSTADSDKSYFNFLSHLLLKILLYIQPDSPWMRGNHLIWLFLIWSCATFSWSETNATEALWRRRTLMKWKTKQKTSF